MKNKNFNWRPMSEYTGGRVLATNGLDVLIGEIDSDGGCKSEEDDSIVLCGITGFIKIEEILPKSEDEMMKKIISDILLTDSDEIREILDANNVLIQDVYAWLKHQAKKGTNGNNEKIPNSAWSENDSPYYDDICEILINLLYSENTKKNKDAIQKDLDWLKSLRPQTTWKPSKEQMAALLVAVGDEKKLGSDVHKELYELYLQLKNFEL